MTNMLRFSSFLVGEGGQERTIYFHKIKHISFHGFVFQATVKLITRALIVIVAPFGESPGAGGGGVGVWLWVVVVGEEYILVRAANCQGSDSKHESGSCIGGCRGTAEAAKPINRPDLSKAATSSTSLAPHINPFLTNWQPPAYFSQ